ncbi:SHOCT domain-containing protein [Paenibacillus wynnii]|uniref:SHOCT domain-containing protein n=1 Tax=Paenibacillus wynnii TaxID=268407 RepID=UPI00068B2D90|nr:SHOCT domain-containing protein [Paenibacillus wynnii]
MNRKRNVLVAGVLALAVTAGSGVFIVGNVSAAEVVQKTYNHFGGKGALFHKVASSEIATLLGLTVDELKTAQQLGKSLAAIAAEKGVAVQKVIDLQVKAITEALDKRLADGKITQAEYDKLKAEVLTPATSAVNAVFDGSKFKGKDGIGGFGRGGFGHGALLANAEVAKLLGLTAEELKTALTSGKSLATLAGEKNVSVQAITDLIKTQLVTELDKQLAAKTITQAQYDELKAKLTTRVSEFVNNTFTGRSGDKGAGKLDRSGKRGANETTKTAPKATDGTTGTSA